MRVGHIDYVNSLPLYDQMLAGKIEHNFEIISDHPSALNEMIREGALDLSPVSSIEYARHQDDYHLLRPFCINSKGAVYSVLLNSRKPIEELNGLKIGLTMASATARSICKIILQDSFGFDCTYVDIPIADAGKMSGVDAELIIGDLAFLLRNKQKYCYDLAEEWLRHYNKPIVFAVWVVRKEFVKKNKLQINEFESKLLESYSDRDMDAIKKKSISILKINEKEIDNYFVALGFDFNQEARDALLFYFKKAAALNLCPPCEKLQFWDDSQYGC